MPYYRIPVQRTLNETVYVEAWDLHEAQVKITRGETLSEQLESIADVTLFENDVELVQADAVPPKTEEYRSAILRENELHRIIQNLKRALEPFAGLIEDPGQFEDGDKMQLAVDPADVKRVQWFIAEVREI